MPKQKFWNDYRTGGHSHRRSDARGNTDRLESVRESITAPVVTQVNPNGDPIAAMTERGRSYLRLLLKSGLASDRALPYMAQLIVKALDEPPIQWKTDGVTQLDGIQTVTAQLDEMGVDRTNPDLRLAIGRAFLTGGMKELERLRL